MVSKMKKIEFLIYHQDYINFLKDLQELGLVHVTPFETKKNNSDKLKQFVDKRKKLTDTLRTIEKSVDKKNPQPVVDLSMEEVLDLPSQLENLLAEKTKLNQQIQVSKKERENLKVWGNFDWDNIKNLEKAGYKIQFFSVPDSKFKTEWEDLYNAVIISKAVGKTNFISVTKNINVAEELQLEEISLPEISLSRLDKLIQDLTLESKAIENKFTEYVGYIPSIRQTIKKLDSEISFVNVQEGSEKVADDKVFVMRGWAPERNADQIANYLQSKDVYFQISDPLPEDDVPIQFNNKGFFRLFEPIAELYMLPKYNEIDLTPYFAPFYMIFFGVALGDIGYGLFLFLVATLVKIFKKNKLQGSMRGILSLVQVLGASTMVSGLLTGGFFGFNLYNIDTPFVQGLKDRIFFDNDKMFTLSLVLGVIQIMFGILMKAANRIKQHGFIHGLSTIGWFIFILSIGIAALLPDKMPMFGTLHLIVAIPALILIVFFNSPGKNIIVNVLSSLWDTYNMATGLLGDILSYIRLFALGLSGGILATVFNSLAAGMSPDVIILKPIIFILIFIFGHTINIFMNVLGSLIHPIRLTFVEFYKNAEFEGGGKKYSPFKKIN